MVQQIVNSMNSRNIVWHQPTIVRSDRERLNNHKGSILWFTGLSASGKSTLANALERELHYRGIRTFILDGDNVRQGLCKDLGFSDKDRTENIRRIGELSKLMMEAGVVVLTAFISPFRRDRQIVRDLVDEEDFIEIFCDASLDTCEQRDPKGLYRKARNGEIQQFTGVSSPYEAPENPELVINTGKLPIEDCVSRVQQFLSDKGHIYLST